MGKSEDIFRTKYFNPCRAKLLLTGLWPYQSKIISIPVAVFLVTAGTIFGSAMLWKIITSRHDMRELIEAVPPYLSYVCAVTKYLNSRLNFKKIKKLIQKIQYDWDRAFFNKEDHIFEFYAKKVWKLNLGYTIILYSVTFSYFTFTIVPELLSKPTSKNITRFTYPPINVEFFVDEEKYFLHILMFICACITIGLMVVLAIDLQLNVIISHACTMFAVVGYRLENVFHFNVAQPDKNAEIERILAGTIKYHCEAIKFVDGINSYCTGCYMVLCGIGILILSIVLFHICILIKSSESYDILTAPLLNFIAHVIMLYFNTIMAQSMIDTSSNVFHQTYCGEWFTAPTSIQKMLLIIMQKTLKPATIIFANVVTLSREKVAMVLQTSTSYFMVLYSLQ